MEDALAGVGGLLGVVVAGFGRRGVEGHAERVDEHVAHGPVRVADEHVEGLGVARAAGGGVDVLLAGVAALEAHAPAAAVAALVVLAGCSSVPLVGHPDDPDDDPDDRDLEAEDDLVPFVGEADAVVFAAGAGPGSGAERKWTVDRDGALKLMDAARRLDRALFEALVSLDGLSGDELRADRYDRFRRLGAFVA